MRSRFVPELAEDYGSGFRESDDFRQLFNDQVVLDAAKEIGEEFRRSDAQSLYVTIRVDGRCKPEASIDITYH